MKDSKVVKVISEPVDVSQMLTGYRDHDGGHQFGGHQFTLYQSQVQYDPAFKVTKPNLSLSIPKFEKMKERQLEFLGRPPTEVLSIEPEKVAKGTLLQAHYKSKPRDIKFGKQLPRDNKMFYISETRNLDNPEQQESTTSFFERINQFESVKEAIRVMKSSSLLNPSNADIMSLKSGQNLLQALGSRPALDRSEMIKTSQGRRETSKSVQ